MKRRTFFGLAASFVRTRVVTVTTFAQLRAGMLAGKTLRFPAGVVIEIPSGLIE